jgi:hypothetical protein
VATDQQIAGNRRNAKRSTGPRSRAGRERSSRNSFRHGLAAGVNANAERIKQVERLTRKIAGATADFLTLECARTIAQAQFDLAQIGRVKVAVMSRVNGFGGSETPSAGAVTVSTTEHDGTADAIRGALSELMKLDRYERRAAVRRARALRSFLKREKRTRIVRVKAKSAKRTQFYRAIAVP